MKNYLVLVCFLFVINSFGQSGLEMRTGLNLARQPVTIEESPLISAEFKLGYQIGATFGVDINDNLILRSGVIYSMKGSNWDIENINLNYPEVNKLNYLEIPMDLVIRKNIFYFNLGPYLAYRLTATKQSGLLGAKFFDLDNDKVQDFEIGANLGFGVKLSDEFLININYGFGLNDVDTEREDVYIRNTNLAFTLSYCLI